MNILITLPAYLIAKITSGRKEYEMRKCVPKNMKIGVDGFFVVEKNTDEVRCWCRVDEIKEVHMNYFNAQYYASRLGVTSDYLLEYANGKKVYLWKIGKVIQTGDLYRDFLFVDRNPQQFAYCPLSYGELY